MKIWAKVIKHHKIVAEAVRDFPARPSDAEGWNPVLTELAKPLDLASPVLLKKHVEELARFSRTVFSPADFIESVSFDRFELEIFPEKKKTVEYIYGED
ncbi:MAG: hypothetical protein GX417_04005 [Clostridiales bacterium]|nr:hypothetical protein [Clostridiales bacterium]